MPKRPPQPSNEGNQRPRIRREMRQLARALGALGPCTRDQLETAVGGAYWDEGRFDKALTSAVARNEVVVDADGRYAPK